MTIQIPIRLCILGKPGSGKGTVSRILTEALPHIHYYNVGGILRDRAAQGDEHIQTVHAAGGLVNSNRVLDIIEEALNHESFILDGSPRKPEEALFVVSHTSWRKIPGFLIHLDISDAAAKERLLSRGRFDDSPDVINSRFDVFNHTTTQAIEVFGSRCITINADQEPQQVATDIIREVSKRI